MTRPPPSVTQESSKALRHAMPFPRSHGVTKPESSFLPPPVPCSSQKFVGPNTKHGRRSTRLRYTLVARLFLGHCAAPLLWVRRGCRVAAREPKGPWPRLVGVVAPRESRGWDGRGSRGFVTPQQPGGDGRCPPASWRRAIAARGMTAFPWRRFASRGTRAWGCWRAWKGGDAFSW